MQRCEEVGRVDCGTYCQEDLLNKAGGSEGGGPFCPLRIRSKNLFYQKFYHYLLSPPPPDLEIFRWLCGTGLLFEQYFFRSYLV